MGTESIIKIAGIMKQDESKWKAWITYLMYLWIKITITRNWKFINLRIRYIRIILELSGRKQFHSQNMPNKPLNTLCLMKHLWMMALKGGISACDSYGSKAKINLSL